MRHPAVRALAALALVVSVSPLLADQNSESMAAEILEERMKTSRPEDLKLLRNVQDRNIVVVRGSMDHIEQVLASAHIRHTLINPEDVAKHDLNADQILMVNCPGHMPQEGVKRIQRFVRAGGLLYTTDWALMNVVQQAFPGTIAASGRSTGDHVTPVHVHKDDDNLMSNMLLRGGTRPQWWLEGGSYPIQIKDPQRVTVLASSEEMGRLYGSSPVVVRFRWEDGEVIHVVSHFYRQIGTKGANVAVKDALNDVEGLTAAQKQKLQAAPPSAAAPMGDVESSYAFQQMTSNLIVEKSKRNKELDKSYKATPKASVSVGGRTVNQGDRLKVLESKNGKARVRDDRGNEAEIDERLLDAR